MILSARIGVFEITGDAVRLAVVKTGRGAPVLLEAHSAAVAQRPALESQEPQEAPEGPGPLAEAVRQVLDQQKTRVTSYVLCAQSAYAVVRKLKLPFRGRRRVEAAVPFELEPFLAFPVDELLLDFEVVRESSGETELLAIGMRRTHLEEQLAALEEAGIAPDAVNIDAVGLTGLWLSTHRPGKGLNAVLHMREEAASLAVTKGKTLVFLRAFTFGIRAIAEDPTAYMREVLNTLRAFGAAWDGDAGIDRLTLTGVTLELEEIEQLEALVRAPVSGEELPLRRKGGLSLPQGSDGVNVWQPLLGVAQAAAGGPLPLDFSPDRGHMQTALRSALPHLMLSSCLALAILLGWALYYHQGAQRNLAQAAELQEQVDALNDELAELEQQGLPGVDNAWFTDPPVLEILLDLAAKMPDRQVQITRVQLSPRETRSGVWVTVEGTATSAQSVYDALEAMQDSPIFAVDPNPELETTGTTTLFTVRAFRPEEVEEENEA